MEEEKKDAFGIGIIPEADDAVTKEDADKVRVLIRLDIAKFRQQRAQAMQMVTDCDLAIAQQEVVLADLDRRVANVGIPDVQAPKKPAMGEPIGGAGKKG